MANLLRSEGIVSSIEGNAATGGRRLGLALTVLACAQLITALDFNIVYVALPEIGVQLGFSPQSLQWVFSAYSVMFGGFLLLGGRAADLFGRRRMFILGLALYALSSLFGGLAHSPIAIVAARAIQGLGGAALFPATVSLINTLFEEGPKRNRALGLWSLAGSTGLTLGSIVGGVLVGSLGWPSVFFVNVPIALAVGLGALKAIPRDEPFSKRKGFDLSGAMTSTSGVTLLVFTLVQAPEWGWASWPVALGAAAVVVLLGLFVLIESRSAHPIMPLRLVTHSGLAAAMALTFLFMGTFMALPYFTTELFQRVYQFSPLTTGFAFLVPCAAIAVGTQIGGRLAARFGVRLLLLLGLAVGAIGAALVAVNVTPGGILGRYNSQVSYGQSRVQVVWNRIILPDTSSLALDNLAGTDPAGYAGLEDGVDWHWDRIFAGAALTTLLGVGAELAAPENRNGDRVIVAGRDSLQDSVNQVGQEMTRRNLNIQPTLTERPGLPVRIIVNRDLVLRPYQPLFFNRGTSR